MIAAQGVLATILGIPLLILLVVVVWRATIGNLGKALDHGKEQWRDDDEDDDLEDDTRP